MLVPAPPAKLKSQDTEAAFFLKSVPVCSQGTAATSSPTALGFISQSPGSDQATPSPLAADNSISGFLAAPSLHRSGLWSWELAGAGRQVLRFRRKRPCFPPLLTRSILSYSFLAVLQLNYCEWWSSASYTERSSPSFSPSGVKSIVMGR